MSTIDRITYRARNGSTGTIYEAATSIRNQASMEVWLHRLKPWLRVGSPSGRAYLDFGWQAAFIRWYADAASRFDWEYAFVLVGNSHALSGDYALELSDPDPLTLDQGGGEVSPRRAERGPGHDALEARARSAAAIEQLIPL